MNTQNETNGQVEIIAAKNPVGRPRSVRKFLYLNADFTPRKKGRIAHGAVYNVVQVDRALKAAEYIHGQTKTYGEMTQYTVPTPEKAVANTIQVHVVPAQEIASEESTETQKPHEALAQTPALV